MQRVDCERNTRRCHVLDVCTCICIENNEQCSTFTYSFAQARAFYQTACYRLAVNRLRAFAM
jgi:hypothetical protein